jgi:signal transduction histidine kinase
VTVFDRGRRTLLDTEPGVMIGADDARLRLDAREVETVFEGRQARSPMFEGPGGGSYMAGYAPITAGDRVVAGVRVDIGAGFTYVYSTFGRSVAAVAVAGSLLTVAVGVALARTLTRPLSTLVAAAREIGRGRLDRPVPKGPADEIGELSATIEAMRKDLWDRERQLRQMLSGVAHEIGNPLGGIALHAGLIADDLPDGDPRKAHIRRVIAEVGTLERVLSEFMAFARPKDPAPAAFELRGVVEAAAFLLAPEMEQGGVRLSLDVAAGVRALADEAQVKRALVNLIRNAVQAMPGGGAVQVSAAATAAGRVVVSVRDDGPGIRPEVMARLFEPFFTTREKGSGLGLVVSRRIAEENGGVLDVESRPGEGTVFRLELPAVKEGAG